MNVKSTFTSHAILKKKTNETFVPTTFVKATYSFSALFTFVPTFGLKSNIKMLLHNERNDFYIFTIILNFFHLDNILKLRFTYILVPQGDFGDLWIANM